jgi:chorismate dehydratase
MIRPKIGAVSYLNTKPLVAGLEKADAHFDLIYDLPSRLADQLALGTLQAALIPSVAANRPEYTIVSDACIGCRGPVWSVKLLGRVEPQDIKSLALDEGSRTSCVLTQILLARRFGIRPECRILGIQEAWRDFETDAVLIIGDRAMNVYEGPYVFSWDLGQSWFEMTGLPFVFAVWAARASNDLDQLNSLLSASRDIGLKNIDDIAQRYASDYDLTLADCRTYLKNRLNFRLGPDEKTALRLFYHYAAELNLLHHQQLQFHDCTTA